MVGGMGVSGLGMRGGCGFFVGVVEGILVVCGGVVGSGLVGGRILLCLGRLRRRALSRVLD